MNDWIIANINNPDFTVSDFKNLADMTTENTQLLKYNEYLQNSLVQETFKDTEGNFNEDLFKQYYASKAQEFINFDEENNIDTVAYNIWDVRRTKNSKVWDPNYSFIKVHNPDRVSMGIEGINKISQREKSVSELAQTSNIYDPATGKYLDYTPNDRALFKEGNIFKNIYNYISSLFDDPLVIAKWEEDGIHEEYGRKVKHKKGDYKLNDEGTYYTEKLNGRSPIGKEFISALDTITVDDSDANHYDFFDADSLDKSVIGSTIKNLAAIAPLALLGPTGATIYGGIYVAREIGKALPMLADIVTMFGENQDFKLLNTIAGYGHKFTGSTSEYAKAKLFSYENFANLASDVALQWGQQKTVVKAIKKISGGSNKLIDSAYAKAANKYLEEAKDILQKGITGKMPYNEAAAYIGTAKPAEIIDLIKSGAWKETVLGGAAIKNFVPQAEKIIQNRTKIGQNLSLAYMALVSNTDVYQSVIEHGGTQKEAAMMALGSMIGMYSVDKFLGLGELFFDDDPARKLFRQTLTRESNDIINRAGTKATTNTKENLNNWLQRGLVAGKNTVKNYRKGLKEHTLGFTGKAIGEGLEEVSEELVTDITKSLGEIAGEYGLASQTNYGAGENALDRYLMSFLGGTMGGGMFYGINARKSASQQQSEQELIYVLRNYGADEVIQELDKLKKRGELGSTTLSINTSEGTFVSADKNNESQNDYVYRILKESILQLDNIIGRNGLKLTENQLFDNLVLSEQRYVNLRDYLQGVSYVTGYQQEYQNLINELIDIEKAKAQLTDADKGSAKEQELLQKEQQLIDRRNKFLNGEHSLHYLKKMLFAIDTGLNSPFLSLNFNQYVRHNYGKDANHLTESEKEKYHEEWEKYSKNSKKKSLSDAFQIYEEMEKTAIPVVESLNENEVRSWGAIAEQLKEQSPLGKLKFWNDKLDSESDEEYETRNTQQEFETPELFKVRLQNREALLEQENNEALQKEYETFIKGQGIIDSNTYRYLLGNLSQRKKDIKNAEINKLYTLDLSPEELSDYDILRDPKLKTDIIKILQTLNRDNEDQVKDEIDKTIKDHISDLVYTKYKDLINNRQGAQEFAFSAFEKPKEAYITLADIFREFERTLTSELVTEDQIRSHLMSFDGDFDSPLGSFEEAPYKGFVDQYIQDTQAIQQILNNPELSEEQKSFNISEIQKSWETPIEISQEDVNKEIDNLYNTQGKQYIKEASNIISSIKGNSWIKTFEQFEDALRTDANPVINLLKVSSPYFAKTPNVEQQLVEIQKTWEELDNPNDFELTEPQLKSLNEVQEQLNYLKAFIYSASSVPSLVTPNGHNRAVNEFAKKHSDKFSDFTPLPELEQDIANVYLNAIEQYTKEISLWTQKALNNQVNKVKEYVEADKALLKARLEFYRSNKLILSDGTDLLEGIDPTEETLANLVKVDNTLYQNFRKAVKKGWKEEDILSELLGKITIIDNIQQQITSPIDRNLSYASLTDYDKFTLLTSILASSDTSFYKKLIKNIESNPVTKDGDKIVPLTVQEYAERVIDASLQNPEFINKALNVVNDKSSYKLPILKNTSIITGVGGAGKSQVVTKMSLEGIDASDILVSGPTESQVEGLQEIFKNSKGLSRKALMTSIMSESEYTKLMNILETGTKSNLTDVNYLVPYDSYQGRVIEVNDNVPLTESLSAKYLVIDEASHFSNVELQILSKAVQKSGTKIILIGDENQESFSGQGLSFDREKVLAWRAPRLGISLRDATYQKIKNIQQVLNILETLRTSTNITPQFAENVYTQEILNINFHYYLEDTDFSGDLITEQITLELINALKNKGTIGYVGEEDDNLKSLRNAGLDIAILNPTKIQGREFDYVVINRNWEAPEKDVTGYNAYKFLRTLYTMMTRSKEGTIFIDNGLSKVINNTRDTTTARATSIKKSFDYFLNYKNTEFSTLDLTEETQEEFEEEKPSEEIKEETSEEETEEKIIKKTEISKEEIEEEERQEVESKKEVLSTNVSFPVRAYGNVHLLGVNDSAIEVEGKPTHQWENINDSRQDIGIFLRSGEKVTDGARKHELSKYLMDLKSIISFYSPELYSRLPDVVKHIVSEEALNNIEYYIQVRDSDTLIGGTNLDQNKLRIKDKVITVVGKFKGSDGNTYSITLGGLADPETWQKNRNKIVSGINRKLEKEPNLELENYKNSIDNIILTYKNKIDELVKKNQEIRINKPNFSKMTELIFNDSDGNPLKKRRIENVNNKRRPWELENPFAVVSKIHLLTKDVPNSSLKKGSVVRYVSSNTLLNSSELETLYWAQKENPDIIPQVRLQVLTNEGVSFRSLYSRSYADLYKSKMGDKEFTFPIDLQYMGVKMYTSVWNFRANLENFLKKYNDWRDRQGLTDEQVEKLLKEEHEEYRRVSAKLGKDYITDEEFRKEADPKFKLIWDFNDSLADNTRQFRLGYSPANGVYTRKLTNIKEDNPFYRKDDAIGLYIVPSLANQYSRLLDGIFTEFLDKIIDNKNKKEVWISPKNKEGWFSQVENLKTLDVTLYDENQVSTESTIIFPPSESLKAIPVLFTEMAKCINFYLQNKDDFKITQEQHSKFYLKIGDEAINYIDNIAELINPVETTDGEESGPLGVHIFTSEESGIQTMDFRFNNLWDIMFHGRISNTNDFNDGLERASDALFRKGMVVDPLAYASNDSTINRVVYTNQKFFSADTNVGFPLLYVSLELYNETTEETKEVEETKENEEIPNELQNINNQLVPFNLMLSEKRLTKINSVEELLHLVNSTIKTNLEQYFKTSQNKNLNEILVNVKIKDGQIVVTTLEEALSNTHGIKIEGYERSEDILIIHTDDIRHINVQYVEGEIRISEEKHDSAEIYTGQQLYDNIVELMAKYPEAFKDVEQYFLQDVEIVFNNINREINVPVQDMRDVLETILKSDYLQAEEGLDAETNEDINKVRDELIQMKSNSCSL